MRTSWRVGTVKGIPIQIHATFWILAIWILASAAFAHQGTANVLSESVFVVLIFIIVVLHELGHALVAKRFGIPTKDITLYPIGGISNLDHIPENPKQEFLVTIAGPAVNVVLAILFLIVLLLFRLPVLVSAAVISFRSLPAYLMWVNVSLALFNILPAFPMDGGRILRSLLSMRESRIQATRTAAMLGQAMALIFALVGLFVNPFLIFIGLFVWMAAAGELKQTELLDRLHGVRVSDLMVDHVQSLDADLTLGQVLADTSKSVQPEFPVVKDGSVLGVTDAAAVLACLRHNGEEATLNQCVHGPVVTATPNELMDEVLPRWQQARVSCVPVVSDGEIKGLLTTSALLHALNARG